MENLINISILLEISKVLFIGATATSVGILVFHLIPDEERAAARKRLGVVEEEATQPKSPLLRFLRPLYRVLVPWISSKVSESQKQAVDLKLRKAMVRNEVSPEDFIALRIVCSILVWIMGVYFSGALGTPLHVFLWPIPLLFGVVVPDLWAWEKISRRRREMIRAMPYTLDLLTLSVEAGLDFIASIQRLVQKTGSNALTREFALLLNETRLGTSRSDALRNLSTRVQMEEITSFTTLLIQADQLGASIGTVLRAQADQLRARRFQAAEAAGARASAWILFPMIFFILPATFIVLVGPTVIGMLTGGLF